MLVATTWLQAWWPACTQACSWVAGAPAPRPRGAGLFRRRALHSLMCTLITAVCPLCLMGLMAGSAASCHGNWQAGARAARGACNNNTPTTFNSNKAFIRRAAACQATHSRPPPGAAAAAWGKCGWPHRALLASSCALHVCERGLASEVGARMMQNNSCQRGAAALERSAECVAARMLLLRWHARMRSGAACVRASDAAPAR